MILRPGSRDVQISQGQSWPCMHFVRIECDSVGPVEKLTRDHVSFLQRSILASLVRIFYLESIWIFRPLGCFDRHHLNFFAQFRPVVLCQYLDIQDLTLVSRECTVSGLESILVFQSQTKHCITSSFATGRFCPSPEKISARVDLDLQASRMYRPTRLKKNSPVSSCRTLSGPGNNRT